MKKSHKDVPSWVFEVSWEVCNKVGGIYTVLSSHARTLQDALGGGLVFVGPDMPERGSAVRDFREDRSAVAAGWLRAVEDAGLKVRAGRWLVQGEPACLLIDFSALMERRDEIYAEAWRDFGIDSLHAYGDYDEASMFSYAAGKLVETIYLKAMRKNVRVVYQAHEWMTGLGMLFLKRNAPSIATVFTTHATSMGRSITGNGKELYKYFSGYDGDQMASELNMEAKHSVEKCAAQGADCLTTVSSLTDRECRQLLGRVADVILPNGFDLGIVPETCRFAATRRVARQKLLKTCSALIGKELGKDTLIVSTSGRNDFRCKGFDVYLEALAQLNDRLRRMGRNNERNVLALIEVPCWTKQPRQDLLQRMESGAAWSEPLDMPMLTHELYNTSEDQIVQTIQRMGLWNTTADAVKVVLIPCYLDGADGVINMEYYDLLTANDLCIYPSYYEPWGYTPLEACAFKTPCVTTDLSGFGRWVDERLGHSGGLEDGVVVMHRDDDNYYDVAGKIADTIDKMMTASPAAVKKYRAAAEKIAEGAQWKYFYLHYMEAYRKAMGEKLRV